MTLWAMIVWVVAIGCLTGVISDYFKTRRVEARRDVQEGGSDAQAELAALRERVEVLEKIVTDRRYDLGEQIDQLERTG